VANRKHCVCEGSPLSLNSGLDAMHVLTDKGVVSSLWLLRLRKGAQSRKGLLANLAAE
jgi:hypothetical protein